MPEQETVSGEVRKEHDDPSGQVERVVASEQAGPDIERMLAEHPLDVAMIGVPDDRWPRRG